MDFPCPIAIHCGDYPFANLSSEGNETCLDCPPTFGAYFTSIGYCCDTTMKVGYSQVSQSDADLVLERILATACPNCDPPQKFCADARCPDGLLLTTTCVPTSQADADALAAAAANAMLLACDDPSQLFQATCSCPDGSNPTTIYSNVSEEVAQAQCEEIPKACAVACSTEQCCGFTHSDGTTIFCCLPPGAICAPTLAQANAMAYSLICGRVQTSIAHLSSLPLFWCLSTLFHEVVTLTGVTGNATQWFLIPHGPPSGLVLTKLTDNTALLEMTPATPGNFIFTIRAVISPTCYVEKLYTLVVFGFTAITPDLPDATVGIEYEYQIVADGGSGNYLFTITDGALPDGLHLGDTGFITGTPTTEETGVFTVTVQDLVTPAMECSMEFQIDVNGAADPFDTASVITALKNHYPLSHNHIFVFGDARCTAATTIPTGVIFFKEGNVVLGNDNVGGLGTTSTGADATGSATVHGDLTGTGGFHNSTSGVLDLTGITYWPATVNIDAAALAAFQALKPTVGGLLTMVITGTYEYFDTSLSIELLNGSTLFFQWPGNFALYKRHNNSLVPTGVFDFYTGTANPIAQVTIS